MTERVVVSPAAGLFEPAPDLDRGRPVEAGDLLGTVGDAEVRSPFSGRIEGVLAHRRERHFLQETRGDDPIRVDVVAGQGDAASCYLAAHEVDSAHFRISLTSATAPVIAAAATMAGLIRSVRPVGLP